jgi:hypothetical protein
VTHALENLTTDVAASQRGGARQYERVTCSVRRGSDAAGVEWRLGRIVVVVRCPGGNQDAGRRRRSALRLSPMKKISAVLLILVAALSAVPNVISQQCTIPIQGAVVHTASHTATAADVGKLHVMNCSNCTFTLPATIQTANYMLWVTASQSSTNVSISPNGLKLNRSSTPFLLGTVMMITTDGSNYWAVAGAPNDMQIPGPNPYVDARVEGLQSWIYATTRAGYQSTATTTANSTSVAIASAMTNLQAGQGVIILGAGTATTAATPATPTITPIQAQHEFGSGKNVPQPAGGSNTSCTKIYAVDQSYGYSASSSEACTTTSWPQGVNSIAATSWTRSGTTITATVTCGSGSGTNCNGSNVPALANGAEVCVLNTSNVTEFGGCYQVSATATSSVSLATQASAANGSSTSATGGTLYWYNGVEVAYANVAGTQWQYVIGLGASGAEVRTGISLPDPSSAWDTITLDWDYFGSTISGLTEFPFYLPSSMPTSAGAGALFTTCVSGCNGRTITVANAATTAVSGAFISMDNYLALTAANASATTAGGIYIPAPPSFNACYPVYGPLVITEGVLQQGNVCGYGTIWIQKGLWNGGAYPQNQSQSDASSFAMDTGHIQIFGHGSYPVVMVGNFGSSEATMNNVTVNTANQNNSIAIFDTNSSHHNYERMGITCGTLYSGICYYNLPSSRSLGFGVTFTNSYILAQGEPNMTQTFAPAVILKNSSENKFTNIALEGRGVLLSYDGTSGGIGLTWDMVGEQQAGIAMFDIDAGGINGQVDILNPVQDTIAAPLIVGSGQFVGIRCFNCSGSDNYPVVTGIFGSLTFSGYNGASTTKVVGANTNIELTAANLTRFTSGNYRAINGANLGFGQILNPQTAPTVTTTTSCYQFPASGSYTYTVAFYDAFSTAVGVDTTLASPGASVTLNGSNCASVTQPTRPAGAVYWSIFRNGYGAAANKSCGLTPVSTTTVLDENSSACGQGSPAQNTTVVSGLGATQAVLPAIGAVGSAPTLSGTGACATTGTQLGSWTGSFACTGTTGASTVTITFATTAPHGWNCVASDQTQGALMPQSGNSTTSCTLSGSVTASDVIVFTAMYY